MLIRGQLVTIKTLDGGRGRTSTNCRKPLQVMKWTARLIGPSPLGHDLWLVKGTAGRGKTATYTVPRHEIQA